MKHYSKIEWFLYKEGCLSEDESRKMEEHLMQCDLCLDLFLSSIDEMEISFAETIISEDFTHKVIDNINKKKEDKIQNRKNIFAYYAAVAAVAIFLTGTGFFQALIHTVPQFTQSAIQKENFNTTTIISWSEKITNKTSHWIDNFGISDKKEESK
jgi:predicted anti-sigma-YlaC factor YlaD